MSRQSCPNQSLEHPLFTKRAVLAVLACGFAVSSLRAGDGVPRLADKEIARREAQFAEAQRLVSEGLKQGASGDDEAAIKSYRQAWEILPDAPATAALKATARDGYSRAANSQARKLAKQARYADAKQLLGSVLEEDFDPDNAEAKRFLKQIDDPERFEPALTPKHLDNVAAVEKLLRLGNGLLSLGDYDGANSRFQDVLRLDAYNIAARKGMEKVEHERSLYFQSARDHQRAARLSEVGKQWEDSVPPTVDVSGLFGGGSVAVGIGETGGKQAILQKLRTYIVPTVDLQGATLEEVVEFLRIRSRELDPRKQGVSFVLRTPPEAKTKPITLNMAHVPLEELVRYVTQMTGTAYRVDEFAVTITSLSERSTTIISKSYRVPPDFISNAPTDPAPGLAAPPDPFAQKGKGAAPAAGAGFGGLQLRRVGAKEFLEQRGVTFGGEASAFYNPATNILLVRNTVENLAIVDDLVEQANSSVPKQVEIVVRMVRVSDTKLTEMGTDWLLGQFNVPGSGSVFASGGTVGNGPTSSATADSYPTTLPGSSTPVGVYPVTSGLRSSGAILGVPSIDGLLQGNTTPPADSRSPGQFALTGAFTDPQFQAVLRNLSQTKGVDLLASPSVVTKSGQRASVTVAREFIYPTEFNPPQIPTTVRPPVVVSINGVAASGSQGQTPVTPTTPTAFAKRDVGITLEVEAVVGADGKTLDLNIVPSSTEFEGFINYGSPIQTEATNALGTPTPVTLTDNKILQPVFRSNKVTTSVSIWDGETVVIGGALTETRTEINDKVPFLGDIPVLGKAFQSHVTQVQRQNLIIYVTARVIDPGGRRLVQQAGPATAQAP